MKILYYLKLLFVGAAFFNKEISSTLTKCPEPQDFTYGCYDDECHYFYGPSFNSSFFAIGFEPKSFRGGVFMHNADNQSRPLNQTVNEPLQGRMYACKYDTYDEENKLALFQGQSSATIGSSNWWLTKRTVSKGRFRERFECASESAGDCPFTIDEVGREGSSQSMIQR